jgi:hypothetical protein
MSFGPLAADARAVTRMNTSFFAIGELTLGAPAPAGVPLFSEIGRRMWNAAPACPRCLNRQHSMGRHLRRHHGHERG